MSNTIRLSNPMSAGAMLAVPRQIWLATIGAVAVTREWAEKEAGALFRTLVDEGSAAESRAIRVLGTRVEKSVKTANAFARDARSGISASVASLARVASRVRGNLPAVHARLDVDTATPKRARAPQKARPAQRPAKTRTAKARSKR